MVKTIFDNNFIFSDIALYYFGANFLLDGYFLAKSSICCRLGSK